MFREAVSPSQPYRINQVNRSIAAWFLADLVKGVNDRRQDTTWVEAGTDLTWALININSISIRGPVLLMN